MNVPKLQVANRALAQLGVTVREVDEYVVEVEPVNQKPIKLTKNQLVALAAWTEAVGDER